MNTVTPTMGEWERAVEMYTTLQRTLLMQIQLLAYWKSDYEQIQQNLKLAEHRLRSMGWGQS